MNIFLILSLFSIIVNLTNGGETEKSLDDDGKPVPSPIERKKRQYHYGNGYGGPVDYGHGGYGYHGMPQTHGVMSPHQMFPNPAGHGGGMLGGLMNPLSLFGSMLGVGRSAQNFQKQILPLHEDDPSNYQIAWPYAHPTDSAYRQVPTTYVEGDEQAGKYNEPVVAYIMSSPYRRQQYFYY